MVKPTKVKSVPDNLLDFEEEGDLVYVITSENDADKGRIVYATKYEFRALWWRSDVEGSYVLTTWGDGNLGSCARSNGRGLWRPVSRLEVGYKYKDDKDDTGRSDG
jgi:hypothetical protein